MQRNITTVKAVDDHDGIKLDALTRKIAQVSESLIMLSNASGNYGTKEYGNQITLMQEFLSENPTSAGIESAKKAIEYWLNTDPVLLGKYALEYFRSHKGSVKAEDVLVDIYKHGGELDEEEIKELLDTLDEDEYGVIVDIMKPLTGKSLSHIKSMGKHISNIVIYCVNHEENYLAWLYNMMILLDKNKETGLLDEIVNTLNDSNLLEVIIKTLSDKEDDELTENIEKIFGERGKRKS